MVQEPPAPDEREESEESEDELILAQAEGLLFRGPLAHVGQIVLSSQAVRFVPTGALDKIVGVSDLEIPVEDITSVSSKGIDGHVYLWTGETSHRFGGPGAGALKDRLEALLAELAFGDGDHQRDTRFERGERVLLRGRADVYLVSMVATRGEITLTDRRLRIECGSGPETWLFHTEDLDCTLGQITNVALVGIRRRLELQIGPNRFLLGGSVVRRLYAALCALGVVSEGGSGDSVLEEWDVSLFQGPRSIPGHLALSDHRVHFTPAGMIDALTGGRDITINLEDVCSISVGGWPERRLVLQIDQEELVFGVRHPLEQFHDLTRLMLGALPSESEDGADVDAKSFFARWNYELPVHEELVLVEKSLHWTDDLTIRCGFLALTDDRVLFMPSCQGHDEPVLALAIRKSTRLDPMHDLPDQIRLGDEDGKAVAARFSTQGGRGFVQSFWDNCPAAAADSDVPDVRGSQPLYRILGEARFLKVEHEGTSRLYLRSSFISREDNGVGILLDRATGEVYEPGMQISIELGQKDGLYIFDTKVVEVMEVGRKEETRRRLLVTVKEPYNIEFTNRRSHFRVEMALPVKLQLLERKGERWQASGTLMCRVDDLSTGGCAVSTSTELAKGCRVRLEIPLVEDEDSLVMEADCVHTDPPEQGRKNWKHGLRFVLLDDWVERKIQDEVSRRQRALLRQRSGVRR